MYYDNIFKGQINEYEKPISLRFVYKKKDTQITCPKREIKIITLR